MADDDKDEALEAIEETPLTGGMAAAVAAACGSSGFRLMGDAELTHVLDQMRAHHDAQPDAPDTLPSAPIDFWPHGKWDDEEDDVLHLLTPAQFEMVPDGAMLISIGNKAKTKGVDEIDMDTRFGCIAWGFRDSQLTHLDPHRMRRASHG
jgi:hypothetical protein